MVKDTMLGCTISNVANGLPYTVQVLKICQTTSIRVHYQILVCLFFQVLVDKGTLNIKFHELSTKSNEVH